MQKLTVRFRKKKRYRFSLSWFLGATLKLVLWIWALRVTVIPSIFIYLLYQCST
jgi:hypothetical protein